MNIYFIDTKYLKDNTTLDNNLSDEILKPFILKAQQVYIHKSLGTNLYNKLKTDVMNNNVSGIYETILKEYIAPCLLEYSLYEAIPTINYKFTNKSISKRTSDNSTYSELNEVKWLRSGVRDMAEYQNQRLINYLKANVSLIPEYQNPGSDIDDIRPNSSSYFNGLYLGNGKSNDCNWGLDLPK